MKSVILVSHIHIIFLCSEQLKLEPFSEIILGTILFLKATSTLSEARVLLWRGCWGQCLHSLLGASSTDGTLRPEAPPGTRLTRPMISLFFLADDRGVLVISTTFRLASRDARFWFY